MKKDSDNKFEIEGVEKIKFYFGSSILVLIVGILISLITSNWLWFSRSGSILVVIGVLMTAYDIESSLKNTKFLEFILKEMEARKKYVTNDEKEFVTEHLESRITSVFGGFFKFLEIKILIIGTLVWGFGDLVGCLYGAQSCT
jgi:hypothetical protein